MLRRGRPIPQESRIVPEEFQKIYDDASSMPARNLSITWKAMLAFWILFLAICCLHASTPAHTLKSAGSEPSGAHSTAVATRGAR